VPDHQPTGYWTRPEPKI